jgi:hypothetical protein
MWEVFMRNHFMRLFAGVSLLVGLGMVTGCAGTGETVKLSLKPVGTPTSQGSGEKVLVVPFQDQRLTLSHLGARTHLWGGLTYFDVTGSNSWEAVAQVVADHLKKTGRQVSYGKPGGSGPDGAPDVTLTGQVRELSANAKSRFGSTAIMVKFHVTLKALNAADGSTTRMTLEGSRDDAVFWFRPEDVEKLLNEALSESLEKALADVKVEGKSWRVKQ